MNPTKLIFCILVCFLFSCDKDEKEISATNLYSIQLYPSNNPSCIRTYQYDELDRLISYTIGECGKGGEYLYTYKDDSTIPFSRSYISTGEQRTNQGRYYEKDSNFLVVSNDMGKMRLGGYQLDRFGRVQFNYDIWVQEDSGLRYNYKNDLLISTKDLGNGFYRFSEHRFTYNDHNRLVLVEQRRYFDYEWIVKHRYRYENDKLIRWYKDDGLAGCEYHYIENELTKLVVYNSRPYPIFMDTTEFQVSEKIDAEFLSRNIIKQYTHPYLELPSIFSFE